MDCLLYVANAHLNPNVFNLNMQSNISGFDLYSQDCYYDMIMMEGKGLSHTITIML
jgi:hypothetical protein